MAVPRKRLVAAIATTAFAFSGAIASAAHISPEYFFEGWISGQAPPGHSHSINEVSARQLAEAAINRGSTCVNATPDPGVWICSSTLAVHPFNGSTFRNGLVASGNAIAVQVRAREDF